MVQLTRLNGQLFLLNSDLIKLIESAPDTVITLVNGEKVIVRDTADQIVERFVAFRRRLLEGLHLELAGNSRPAETGEVIRFRNRSSEAV
jgi:uncharacterized protein YlzI (FlbEa/FlbD family)